MVIRSLFVAVLLSLGTAMAREEVRFVLPPPAATVAASSHDVEALLAAIRMREGAPRGETGSDGGRGHYQFMPKTWRQHTTLPLSYASRRAVADQIARAHLEWLEKTLLAAGVEPTPYRLAMAWNAGVGAVLRDSAPSRARRYAEHVSNLYHDFLTSGYQS